MYEGGIALKIGGREFKMVFTLAAFLEIKKRYGGITKMAEALEGPTINEWDSDDVKQEKSAKREAAKEASIEEVPWLIAALANQGELLSDPQAERVTPEWVALHILPKEIGTAMGAVYEAIADGTRTETVAEENDPVLEEIEQKNAEGAGGK